MIESFRDRETERVFQRRLSRRLPGEIQRVAYRNWFSSTRRRASRRYLCRQGTVWKRLSRDRRGQHSIRTNDQWRICFVWRDGDAYEVEIADFH